MRATDIVTVIVLGVAIAVLAAFAWSAAGAVPSAAFTARVQIVYVAVTAAAAVVALWYAYLTRQLAHAAHRQADSADRQIETMAQQLTIAERQLEAAREQLAMMNQEIHDSRVARLQDQKPIVFIDRVEDENDPRNYRYVARNVGGGFALNVYCFDVTIMVPVSLGALSAGSERTLPAELNRAWCDGGAGLRSLVVAEAPFTRTTQWTPTVNLRTQTAGAHKGQVLHRTATVVAAPPRHEAQGLSDYMTANRETFHVQLTALTEEEHLGPRLLDRRLSNTDSMGQPS